MRPLSLPLAMALLAAAPLPTQAQSSDKATTPQPAPAGSGGFCLYELPARDGTTRFINLGIVQYVELNRERLRITYGGGKFGSGYDADIPVRNRDDGLDLIKRMQVTARECARHLGMGGPGAAAGMAGMRGMMNQPDAAAADPR